MGTEEGQYTKGWWPFGSAEIEFYVPSGDNGRSTTQCLWDEEYTSTKSGIKSER